jgi:hypothetical protein
MFSAILQPRYTLLVTAINNVDTVITLVLPSFIIVVSNVRISYALSLFYRSIVLTRHEYSGCLDANVSNHHFRNKSHLPQLPQQQHHHHQQPPQQQQLRSHQHLHHQQQEVRVHFERQLYVPLLLLGFELRMLVILSDEICMAYTDVAFKALQTHTTLVMRFTGTRSDQ